MPRYMGKCRNLTSEQIEQYEAEGRKPTVRFRVPADQQILVRDRFAAMSFLTLTESEILLS